MASQREVVAVRVLMEGMGRSVSFIASVIKVSVPGTSEFTYRKLDPSNMPVDLPDGVYTITYAWITEPVRKQGRELLAVCP